MMKTQVLQCTFSYTKLVGVRRNQGAVLREDSLKPGAHLTRKELFCGVKEDTEECNLRDDKTETLDAM